MKLENNGLEIHVKITADDVDRAVKDWFASRGFAATPRKWVKTSEKKPTREGIYIISCVTHNRPWVTIATWKSNLQNWVCPGSEEEWSENARGMVVAWMEMPEPYWEDEECES